MKHTVLKTFLAAAAALTMAGCGSSSTTSTGTAGNTEKTTILIGTSPDFPPFESLTTSGEIEGFEVDMIEWMFNWFDENGYNYDYEWKQMSFDTIISALQANQIDLGVSGFTYDEERTSKVLFTESFYTSAQVVIVTADSPYTTSDDVKGLKLAAQSGTTGQKCAEELSDDVQGIQDMGIVMETLKSGGVEAVVVDGSVAQSYANTGEFKILEGKLLEETYHFVVEKSNSALKEDLDAAIKAYMASDAYAEDVAQWLETSN